ncbi:MAG TPA: NAD(P)-dependent oxidoreductase [Chthonomonadaceae bacterium]|nr:NAD(P)-dependent oxidoreductase [Chthonomonadaceae bacterium]
MNRVLVTGATGFIGRHALAPLVAGGDEVHAVTIDAPVEAAPEVAWHQADLLDPGCVADLLAKVRPTHLLHFAWYVAPGQYVTSPENFRWVQASLELLRRFAECGGQRVVMSGSCFEYDLRYGYCSERVTPLAPDTLYGTCKHALHTMLVVFADQAGLSQAWGRIFYLYGPHEYPQRLVPSVIRALLDGETARCSHGRQIRDFLHVQDVAGAFVALLRSDVAGPVNIASGQPVALQEVIGKIAARLNAEDRVQLGVLPAPPSEPPLIVADTRRLREEVGWRPHYDLDSGLEQTISWHRRSSG